MTYVAPRTCTVVNEGEEPDSAASGASPLSSHAETKAYVLIAEPGAGKTTSFKEEADSQGGMYVTVRDFLTFNARPKWRGATLFLDGLDESRAGTEDGRTSLDRIRNKLDQLGCPSFRLSCRWADWMAVSDKDALSQVSPDGDVTVIRLEPLSEQNIKDILAKNHGVEDPTEFIEEARERGVDRLLTNPQNLDLLAKLVAQGEWPDSRKETFEQACLMLAGEHNGEHLAGNPSMVDLDQLIHAAGRLCAAQLFSGVAGYTLPDKAKPDDDYPAYTDVDTAVGNSSARNALGTRLFVGVAEGKLAPAHRQVAEFLAAQYVSTLIVEGLPLERILALITGFDGELLPSFSNFASWLAVHSKQSRSMLSRLDPLGLIYVAGQRTYSTDEKRDIVVNLRREHHWNPWCTRSLLPAPGIGRIVSPELEGTFQEILGDANRDNEHQSYVMLLLQVLADGEPLSALSDVLEDMVRDATWKQGVRCAALDVLTKYHADGSLASEVLTNMAACVQDGSLDDPQDELLGILLAELYPSTLSSAEVLQYLSAPKLVDGTGEYSRFWRWQAPKESTPEQSAELLDGIAERFPAYRPFIVGDFGSYTGLGRLSVELLDRVLSDARRSDPRGSVDLDRLYEWLSVVSDPVLHLPDRQRANVNLSLTWNQDALKALIAHGVETSLQRGEDCMGLVDRRLFGARPWDYGPWCIEKAIDAGQGQAVSFYLTELLDCLTDEEYADGLTAEGARARLAEHEALLDEFDELVARRSRSESGTEPRAMSGAESVQDTPEQQTWQAEIEAEQSELSAGRGSPDLLHRAAVAYMGIQEESGRQTPRQRFGALLGSRADLIDPLMAGIEGSVARDDLPGCDDVVRLFDQRRVDWLALSFAAGLHSLEQSNRLSADELTESQTRLAVTILYTLPQWLLDPKCAEGNAVYRPQWFQDLLRNQPALVGDVLRRSAALKLETGVQLAVEIRELASEQDHQRVAELMSISVLEEFPNAETDAALQALCWALHAALKESDWSELVRLIEERLARDDLGAEERSCWLTAGVFVSPSRYRGELQRLSEDEDRLKGLTRFMAVARLPRKFAHRLAPQDISSLVDAVGAALRLDGLPELAYRSTLDLIDMFGDDLSPAATETLETLRSTTGSAVWAAAITASCERQARKRREHEYRHGDISQVVETLDNQKPANAGDLTALVFDELKDLSLKIRDGSTSDWRQHWNVDSYNRPKKPKPEDACRDAILSDLKERLGRLGIDAQPEGVYAEDNRSDIRVSYDAFNVPVEIKRSCHPDLWTAVQDQLVAKYTRDPGAAGYGIYLVLWFGNTKECRPTKSDGCAPEDTEDVRLRIEQSLSDRQRRLITVCIVDVSAPR